MYTLQEFGLAMLYGSAFVIGSSLIPMLLMCFFYKEERGEGFGVLGYLFYRHIVRRCFDRR